VSRRELLPLLRAGLLLGVGLGAFVDGIVLHQLLQWHSMLSSQLPPTDLVALKVNMVWDGVFHAFAWATTAAGVLTLYRAARRNTQSWSAAAFGGALLSGWGLFNAVEGVIDHHLLELHHVHPGEGQLAWDLGFVALGVVQVLAGALLIRRGASAPWSLYPIDNIRSVAPER
jgi:uncharacterized membrane protein